MIDSPKSDPAIIEDTLIENGGASKLRLPVEPVSMSLNGLRYRRPPCLGELSVRICISLCLEKLLLEEGWYFLLS